MRARRSYTARCRRSGAWWAIDVPELRGVYSQARRLDQVEAMARDAIALLLDVSGDSFDVILQPVLPEELKSDLEAAKTARSRADDAGREAQDAVRRVTRRLHEELGLAMRDAGAILGVSHQRVQQLLRDRPEQPHRSERRSMPSKESKRAKARSR
jgi:predicted RNase H-like HicB family nuclease